jgi:hypothetical protein
LHIIYANYFATATNASFFRRATEENAEAFLDKLNSHNSTGCTDGKHIRLRIPQNIEFNILYFQAVFLFFAGCM